jgi:uncharacterized protein
MSKKITGVSITVLLVVFTVTLVVPSIFITSANQSNTPRFTDEVGLLTETQSAELTAKLDAISTRLEFDVVVVVKQSISTTNTRLYAADFYEAQGFGFGDGRDGIILLIAMQHRDFAFVTTGYGLHAFTDAGQEYMEKLFLPYLRNDDYFNAFITFADSADDLVTRARAGQRYDRDNIPLTPAERRSARLWSAGISLALAFLIPAAVVGAWTRQLKSVRKKDFACDYIRPGSMALTLQRDIFLHRRVSRTPRSQNSGGGGGSGSFKSSSGSSFSGRSGRF